MANWASVGKTLGWIFAPKVMSNIEEFGARQESRKLESMYKNMMMQKTKQDMEVAQSKGVGEDRPLQFSMTKTSDDPEKPEAWWGGGYTPPQTTYSVPGWKMGDLPYLHGTVEAIKGMGYGPQKPDYSHFRETGMGSRLIDLRTQKPVYEPPPKPPEYDLRETEKGLTYFPKSPLPPQPQQPLPSKPIQVPEGQFKETDLPMKWDVKGGQIKPEVEGPGIIEKFPGIIETGIRGKTKDKVTEDKPIIRNFQVGDRIVPHEKNKETGRWFPIPGLGGPKWEQREDKPATQTEQNTEFDRRFRRGRALIDAKYFKLDQFSNTMKMIDETLSPEYQNVMEIYEKYIKSGIDPIEAAGKALQKTKPSAPALDKRRPLSSFEGK